MDIISIRDFSRDQIEKILSQSEEMDKNLKEGVAIKSMAGKILATLFFEPSTRTRLSFTSAMQRLGGQALGFGAAESTSIAKGENLTDTVKTIEKYCDVIVLRHPKEGSARYITEITDRPVLNAGDGANQHPTQTLLDLYTIKKLKGKVEGLNVGLLGDLKHARVIKSLTYALSIFKARITLISPPGLEIDRPFIDELSRNFDVDAVETNDIQKGAKETDVLYVCRIQKERFEDSYEAERLQRAFRVTSEALSDVKEDLIILHSLPKVTEIATEIDGSKYAKYFEQVYYGIPVRMALLEMALND